MHWNRYEPLEFNLGSDCLLEKWMQRRDKAEAKTFYEHLMVQRDYRISQVRELLDGIVCTDCNTECIQAVNEWLVEHAEPDPSDPARLKPIWYSVVMDLSLWYGECLIERRPHLRWSLCLTPTEHLNVKLPVIKGFRNVENKDYQICPLRKVSGTALQAAELKAVDEYRAQLPTELARSMFDEWLDDVQSGRISLTDRFAAAFESTLERE